MAAMSYIIPPEIAYRIIDELSPKDDRETLSSVSQTCERLLRYCRSILFKDIRLDNRVWKSRRTVIALHDALAREGNKELGSYIKSLFYRIDIIHAQDPQLISILRRLSKLEHLDLFFPITGITNWDQIPIRLKDALRSLLSLDSLKKISLYGINLKPFNFPVTELGSARNLRDLDVHPETTFYVGPHSLHWEGFRPPCLHIFSVRDDGFDADWSGINWLLGPKGIMKSGDVPGFTIPAHPVVDFTNLKELTVLTTEADPKHWGVGKKIMEIGRKTLEHMKIEVIGQDATLEGLGKCITDDSGMPNLKSLIFITWADPDPDSDSDPDPESESDSDANSEDDDFDSRYMGGLRKELYILESASDKHALERIDITINISGNSTISTDVNDWRELKDVFLRPGFQKLRQLALSIDIVYTENRNLDVDGMTDIERRLSNLEETLFIELEEKEGLEFDFFNTYIIRRPRYY